MAIPEPKALTANAYQGLLHTLALQEISFGPDVLARQIQRYQTDNQRPIAAFRSEVASVVGQGLPSVVLAAIERLPTEPALKAMVKSSLLLVIAGHKTDRLHAALSSGDPSIGEISALLGSGPSDALALKWLSNRIRRAKAQAMRAQIAESKQRRGGRKPGAVEAGTREILGVVEMRPDAKPAILVKEIFRMARACESHFEVDYAQPDVLIDSATLVTVTRKALTVKVTKLRSQYLSLRREK